MIVEGPKTLTLTADKPGEVTSRMIQEDADIEVLDKDVYIATVSEGGTLHIEMRVKIGAVTLRRKRTSMRICRSDTSPLIPSIRPCAR